MNEYDYDLWSSDVDNFETRKKSETSRPLARGGVPQAGGGQTAHVVFVGEGHLEAPCTHPLTYTPQHLTKPAGAMCSCCMASANGLLGERREASGAGRAELDERQEASRAESEPSQGPDINVLHSLVQGWCLCRGHCSLVVLVRHQPCTSE